MRRTPKNVRTKDQIDPVDLSIQHVKMYILCKLQLSFHEPKLPTKMGKRAVLTFHIEN